MVKLILSVALFPGIGFIRSWLNIKHFGRIYFSLAFQFRMKIFVPCSFINNKDIIFKRNFFNETRTSQEKSKLFLRQCHVKNCKRKKVELCVQAWIIKIYVYDKIQNRNGIYLLKVNNKNTRKVWNKLKAYHISKLTMKTPDWCQWRRSDEFFGNFEHIWVIDLMFSLLIFE